ncbi:MAG: hypothetical protein JNK15_03840 [Planctomycetes bacterium]|nr:hypothetical protein [Planctomycetota bacterium]
MVEFPPPERPDCEQYMFGWGSGRRIATGALATVVASVLTVQLWDLGLLWKFPIAVGVFGFWLVVHGCGDLRRKRRLEAEVDRAGADWDELVRTVGAARGRGAPVARLLQERGYREFDVRQWMLREIDALVVRARESSTATVAR